MARVTELLYMCRQRFHLSNWNVIVLFPDPQFQLSLWAELFSGYCFCMFVPFAHILRSTWCAGPVWSMYMAVCDMPARLLHPFWLTCSLLSAMMGRLLLDGIEPWIAVQLCLRTLQTRVWIMLQWKHLWCWCLGAVWPNACVYLHVYSHHCRILLWSLAIAWDSWNSWVVKRFTMSKVVVVDIQRARKLCGGKQI